MSSDITLDLTLFRVNGIAPPVYALPTTDAPPVITRPEPQAMYGDGKPARAVGLAFMECGRLWINREGIAWWMQFFQNPSDQYVAVTVTAYDPLRGQWITANANMWQPRFAVVARGGYRFRDFRVRFTGIEV